jgi:hypothetical protein
MIFESVTRVHHLTIMVSSVAGIPPVARSTAQIASPRSPTRVAAPASVHALVAQQPRYRYSLGTAFSRPVPVMARQPR